MRRSTTAALLLSAALTLPLAGCSTLTPGQPSRSALDSLPLVQNSELSPCWQQRQIAQQHAYVDAAKGARVTAYKGPCDWKPKVAPAPGAAGKATS